MPCCVGGPRSPFLVLRWFWVLPRRGRNKSAQGIALGTRVSTLTPQPCKATPREIFLGGKYTICGSEVVSAEISARENTPATASSGRKTSHGVALQGKEVLGARARAKRCRPFRAPDTRLCRSLIGSRGSRPQLYDVALTGLLILAVSIVDRFSGLSPRAIRCHPFRARGKFVHGVAFQGLRFLQFRLLPQGVALGWYVVAPAGRRTAQHQNSRFGLV